MSGHPDLKSKWSVELEEQFPSCARLGTWGSYMTGKCSTTESQLLPLILISNKDTKSVWAQV